MYERLVHWTQYFFYDHEAMEQSFAHVRQLVEDFKAQEAAYLQPHYQKSQVRQIDEAVYELYGLTEEERRIVEGR